MKADDFAVWLAAISEMSEAQRAEAVVALGAAEAEISGRKAGRRSRREDALGTTGVERVAAQGCPHCAGREVVGWGRSGGLLRFRCKSCGRTFNALTKTPMAHLRKKEKWLDHARAMIEGKSLAKTAALCGVHPTTAFRWRHRFLRAPASTSREPCVGSWKRTKPSFSNPSRAAGPICRAATQTRRNGQTCRPSSGQLPVLVARDRKGATFDAVLPQVDGASIGAALAGIVTPGNHLIGDGGKAIAAFARQAGIPFHAVPSPGKPAPEAPHLHINNVNAYHSRLEQWLGRFNGVATKNLPNYLGWRRALEAWSDKLDPPNWVKGAIGNGPYQQITL